MNNTNESANEIEIIEHNLQHLAMQNQAINVELNEATNALNELNTTSDDVYRMIGNIMLRANPELLKKELEERKHVLELRLSSIEKQELLLDAKMKQIRSELLKGKSLSTK